MCHLLLKCIQFSDRESSYWVLSRYLVVFGVTERETLHSYTTPQGTAFLAKWYSWIEQSLQIQKVLMKFCSHIKEREGRVIFDVLPYLEQKQEHFG